MLAVYFCKICIRLAASGCKFHSVSHQPAANLIKLAAGRMQISFSQQYKIPSLHAASDQSNEICTLLAASQMQILQKQAASTLLSC
jgi:hypothetical protein